MATKKKKAVKKGKNEWTDDGIEGKIGQLKVSSASDDETGSDAEHVAPVSRGGKSAGVFNMLASLESDKEKSSDDEKSDNDTEKKVETENVAKKKQPVEKLVVNAAEKPKEKGKGKKGKKAKKEDDDLDALLADLEKPIEKPVKGKKKAAAVKETEAPLTETVEKTVESAEPEKMPEVISAEAVEETAEKEAGDVIAKKKDKKKKKKTADKEKTETPEMTPEIMDVPSQVDKDEVEDEEAVGKKSKKKKSAKGKDGDKKESKKSKQVEFIKEILRKRQEEEERILKELREEEERLAAEQKALEEEERLAKEKKEKEKQRKKEREEKLKAEGKYLTPQQKEKLRRQQALLSNTNIILPAAFRKEGEAVVTKRPVYGKKKSKKPVAKEVDLNDATPAVPEPTTELITEAVTEVSKEDEVADAWDASDEEPSQPEKKQEPIKSDVGQVVSQLEKEKIKEIRHSPKHEELTTKLNIDESVKKLDTDEIKYQSESSSESESDEEEESSEEETEARETIELRKEKVRARLKKRRELALSKRSTNNLRSPVICVLGHVDTGKTKMLDTIRRTNVQVGEAGGITQQIGATQVPGSAITERTKMIRDFNADSMKIPGFLIIDTPGHESFSNLRSRGSSLCDYAILVVDLMHGLEQQTLESLKLLRKRGTPFVIALNKIDRLYDYESNPRKDIYQHLKAQPVNTQLHFKELKDKVVLQFAEQGINVAVANENPDQSEYVSMVPTSAVMGDGIGNLMAHIVVQSETVLAEKLAYHDELECTVMEVKSLPGLGTTIDVILVNGKLQVGDIIVLTGTDGAIMTQIRELLMPQPLKELRVKNVYDHFQMIKGAQGVKVLAKNLDKALAGLSMFVAEKEDELSVLKEDCEAQLSRALMSIKKKPEGVYVQASTLGSLEALLEFLRAQKIPYANVNIGPVHKRDVQKAAAMLERKEEYACILAFDVRVDREVEQFAASEGVRIFSADIIYHLEDNFLKYREELRLKRRRDHEHLALFPCKLRIMPQHVFNARNPIVVGVSIEAGQLKRGVPLCVPSKDCIYLGSVSSIERNHEQVEIARTGEEVCIKIENTTGEAPKLYGRHFTYEDTLVSRITRETIDVCKMYFRDDLSKADWQLVVQLKKLLDIM